MKQVKLTSANDKSALDVGHSEGDPHLLAAVRPLLLIVAAVAVALTAAAPAATTAAAVLLVSSLLWKGFVRDWFLAVWRKGKSMGDF